MIKKKRLMFIKNVYRMFIKIELFIKMFIMFIEKEININVY